MQDEAGYRFVFEKAREIGADCVQVSGAPELLQKPDLIRSLSEEFGIEVSVTHPPFERIAEDIDNLCEEHLRFGCTEIGISAMPSEYRDHSFAEIDRFVEIVNKVAERAAEHGVTIAYHNHSFENDMAGTRTVFDHLIEDTSINFIPDTFWLKVCGLDPVEFLNKIAGRVKNVHYKDYSKFFVPRFRAVGDGKLDFAAIDATARRIGAEYCLVEIDIARNPLKSVTRSMRYLDRFRD